MSKYDEGNLLSVESEPQTNDGSATKLFLGLAVLALGQAIQDRNGFISVSALGWLTLAVIFACLGVVSQKRLFPLVSTRIFWVILVTGFIFQLYQLLATLPGIDMSSAYLHILWQFRAIMVFGGVCALLSVMPKVWFNIWLRRGLIAAVLLAVLVAGVWIIRAILNPWIDVFLFQRTSSQALLQGHNHYELTPPNIYGNLGVYAYEPAWINNDNLTVGNPFWFDLFCHAGN